MTVLPRLFLRHKQPNSSRLGFLCLNSGVLVFGPLSANSLLRHEDDLSATRFHPVAAVREAELLLGLPEGVIVPEAEFQAWACTPEGDVPALIRRLQRQIKKVAASSRSPNRSSSA